MAILELNFTEVCNVAYLSSLLKSNIKFARGEGHIKALWKNITWIRKNGKQYPILFNEAIGKNIKWIRVAKALTILGKSRLKIWIEEEYQVISNYTDP